MSNEAPKDVLVVVSKLKAHVKTKAGFNTSDGVVPVLSELVKTILDAAVERARKDGRKTVMDRDIRLPDAAPAAE